MAGTELNLPIELSNLKRLLFIALPIYAICSCANSSISGDALNSAEQEDHLKSLQTAVPGTRPLIRQIKHGAGHSTNRPGSEALIAVGEDFGPYQNSFTIPPYVDMNWRSEKETAGFAERNEMPLFYIELRSEMNSGTSHKMSAENNGEFYQIDSHSGTRTGYLNIYKLFSTAQYFMVFETRSSGNYTEELAVSVTYNGTMDGNDPTDPFTISP